MKETFEVTSGTMVCSDPCYTVPTWCQGIIRGVKNGMWKAGIAELNEGEWGKRIARLWVYLDGISVSIINKIENFEGELLNVDAGVDSGQFGFFDFAHYRNDKSAEGLPKANFGENYCTMDGDEWYLACCEATLGNKEGWGVLPFGVVSTSGYGDGSYNVCGIKDNNGEFIAFCVEFIGEDEDDEYNEDDEDEW